jgi:hypothetical protein
MLLCVTPLVAFAEGEAAATTEPNWTEVKDTVSDTIVNWIIPHIEEISVIITLVLSCFYQMRKHKLLNKSMGTLNNNAITVAEKSTGFMTQALSNIECASDKVTSYEAKIIALLEAYQQTAEDKKKLENELVEIKEYLKTSVDANVEFADELAELLGLANIPNYKKEEIGARHVAAKKKIIEEKAKAVATALPTNTEEVKGNVGEEKEN